MLLDQRVEKKMHAKVSSNMVNRIHVAMPRARDEKERAPCIPKSVLEKPLPDAPLTKQERAMKQLEDRLAEEQREDAMWANGEIPGMDSKLWRGM